MEIANLREHARSEQRQERVLHPQIHECRSSRHSWGLARMAHKVWNRMADCARIPFNADTHLILMQSRDGAGVGERYGR